MGELLELDEKFLMNSIANNLPHPRADDMLLEASVNCSCTTATKSGSNDQLLIEHKLFGV